MLNKQTDIAATIGARICHDLISPIGAISNGLELLELSGTPQSPELALIAESVKTASAKVRFLRIAFGDTLAVATASPAEIHDILNGNFDCPHISLHWTITHPIERRDLKLLFLLLLCVEKIAAYGGSITVAEIGQSFQISLAGQDLKTDGFVDFQTHRLCPKDGPSYVQFNLAQAQMDQMSYNLKITHNTDEISFMITT